MEILNEGYKTTFEVLGEDPDFKEMRHFHKQVEFESLFKQGYKLYIKGDWPNSEKKLNECLRIRPGDGPSTTILTVIDSDHGIAPSTWKGYRELTEK